MFIFAHWTMSSWKVYLCQPDRTASPRMTLPRFAAVLALIVLPLAGGLLAQPPVGGPPPCWPPPCIPIDGGIGLLMAAGAIIGGRSAISLRRARHSK